MHIFFTLSQHDPENWPSLCLSQVPELQLLLNQVDLSYYTLYPTHAPQVLHPAG